jgi:hypothetical protein
LVNTACIALIESRWAPSPKAPATAVRIAAFGINSEDTSGSLFHHCSERVAGAPPINVSVIMLS